MEKIYTFAPSLCNESAAFTCYTGLCVNLSRVCDGTDDCGDGSDETLQKCAVRPGRLSALEVTAIVVACVVGTVILCCLLGTIIDCSMHVYKYWCSCLHKAYQCPSDMIALRAQSSNPNDSTVLVVRAIPPSFSTFLVSCEPSSSGARSHGENESLLGDGERSRENSGDLTRRIDLSGLINRNISRSRTTTVSEISTDTLGLAATEPNDKKEIATQTSSPSLESLRLLSSHTQTSKSSELNLLACQKVGLPPSYSTIFKGDVDMLNDKGAVLDPLRPSSVGRGRSLTPTAPTPTPPDDLLVILPPVATPPGECSPDHAFSMQQQQQYDQTPSPRSVQSPSPTLLFPARPRPQTLTNTLRSPVNRQTGQLYDSNSNSNSPTATCRHGDARTTPISASDPLTLSLSKPCGANGVALFVRNSPNSQPPTTTTYPCRGTGNPFTQALPLASSAAPSGRMQQESLL